MTGRLPKSLKNKEYRLSNDTINKVNNEISLVKTNHYELL